jgi:hypothetical protein
MISPHHHEKRKILLHIFGFFFVIALIGLLFVFDRPIRRAMSVPRQLVAGVQDKNAKEVDQTEFKEEITDDSLDVVEGIKHQVMNTTLTDLVTMARRTEKVVKDINSAKNEFEDFVHSISLPKSLPLNK